MDVDSSFTAFNGPPGGGPFNGVSGVSGGAGGGGFPQPQGVGVGGGGTGPQVLQQPDQKPLIGMIVPGGPVRTDFVPTDATGTRFTLTLSCPGDLPTPVRLVNELVFFLTDPSGLQPNTGLLIYWQLRIPSTGQESGFELLGALWSPNKPSDVFRTGWAEHEQFMESSASSSLPSSIVFGVSVEPLSTIQNIMELDGNALAQPWGAVGGVTGVGTGSTVGAMTNGNNTNKNRPMVAHKIAEDLYNYMMSFDTGGATGNQTMTVPANIFDRWWTRFEAKVKRDPNFFLKNS